MSWIPILKASVARSLFLIHGIVTVCWAVGALRVPLYYLLLLPVLILLVEMIVSTKITNNADWKWFFPSVCMYLTSVVPGLWLLQLNQYERQARHREEFAVGGCEGSDVATNRSSFPRPEDEIVFPFDDELVLEQSLLALLILGRWLLPKVSLTHDQLSQLLLVHVGTAADVLEFSTESKKVVAVACSRELTIVILSLWTVSLLRYTVVMHSTPVTCEGCLPSRCNVEKLSTWLTILMQDGPFLVMRIYLLVDGGVVNYNMMLFFTLKNALMVLHQAYRMMILVCSRRGNSTNSNTVGSELEDI